MTTLLYLSQLSVAYVLVVLFLLDYSREFILLGKILFSKLINHLGFIKLIIAFMLPALCFCIDVCFSLETE
jgi:hypothetical protein